MNRIILIGNGFDLAHGLKTSYRDFINDFWRKIVKDFNNRINRVFENEFISISNAHFKFNTNEHIPDYKTLNERIKGNNAQIKFKNNFLKTITEKLSLTNWVDIEEEFYILLLECMEDKSGKEIRKLNKEFASIRNSLIEFLNTIEMPDIKKEIKEHIFAEIKTEELTKTGAMSLTAPLPKRLLFLTFNYTFTEDLYSFYNPQRIESADDKFRIPSEVIHIHGDIQNTRNPVIFGYGDEYAKEYTQIEECKDNEYLNFFKTIQYLKTDNYKRVRDFIESDTYQVFLMGVSGGNPDRTFLKTLFEHDNCVSIKPFYHQVDKKYDNYDDIIKNISRHFSDKAMMRDKVVNKQYCVPLLSV
jgi:hypothetical protein